jgi:transposase
MSAARDARNPEDLRRGRTIKGTATKAGCDRATVKAALGRRRVIHRKKATKSRPPGKLEPFLPMLQTLVVDDGLTAVLAFEELRTAGFGGGYSIVKDAVRKLRPKQQPTVTTVVDHPPGAEGQVDWSPYNVLLGGEARIVHAFSMVLPFSRYIFVRFALNEQLDTLLRLHEEAFTDLDAVPTRPTTTRMTTVGRHTGPAVSINPQFAAWAKHEFSIRLTRPGRPNDHAPVERHMHYIERNCLLRRRSRFTDLEDLNLHAKTWCATVANVRIHGKTRRRPVDQLGYERSFMKALPSARPEPYRTQLRKVGTDFCVAYDTNTYSVSPQHVGHDVTVRVYPERVEIWLENKVLATHPRTADRHRRHVLPEHAEEFLRVTPSRRLLEAAFLRLGPTAETFYEGLVAQRGQRILRLAERRGTAVVIGAMSHAAKCRNYSADAVTAVIAGGGAPGAPPRPGRAPCRPRRVQRWLEGLHVEEAVSGLTAVSTATGTMMSRCDLPPTRSASCGRDLAKRLHAMLAHLDGRSSSVEAQQSTRRCGRVGAPRVLARRSRSASRIVPRSSRSSAPSTPSIGSFSGA